MPDVNPDHNAAPVICKLGFKEQCRVVTKAVASGFRHDGCTLVPDWGFGETCCGEHDVAYWEQTKTRREADRKLRECILKVSAQHWACGNYVASRGITAIAWTYWAGVRIGGWYFWNRRGKQNAAKREDEIVAAADAAAHPAADPFPERLRGPDRPS